MLYINYLVDCMGNHVSCKLLANDVKTFKMLRRAKAANNTDSKQLTPEKSLKMDQYWQMPIFLAKLEILHLGPSNPRNDYTSSGNIAPSVSSFRNLGAVITKT